MLTNTKLIIYNSETLRLTQDNSSFQVSNIRHLFYEDLQKYSQDQKYQTAASTKK